VGERAVVFFFGRLQLKVDASWSRRKKEFGRIKKHTHTHTYTQRKQKTENKKNKQPEGALSWTLPTRACDD